MDKIKELLKGYERVTPTDGNSYMTGESDSQEKVREGGSILVQTKSGDHADRTDITNFVVDKEEDVMPSHYDQLVEVLHQLKDKNVLIRSGPDVKKYFSGEQGREVFAVVTRIIYYV